MKLQTDCHQAYGEKLGEREFKRITSIGFNGCEHQVDFILKLFDWFEKLDRANRKIVAQKAGHWTALNTLIKLPKVPVTMEWFFYLVDLHLEEVKKRNYPTGTTVQQLIDALEGKRKIDWDTPMTVIDWMGLVNVRDDYVKSLNFLCSLEVAKSTALQIAQKNGREKVFLEDALAALESLGKKIELGEVAQPKPRKQESLEVEFQRKIQQVQFEKDQELAIEREQRLAAEKRALAAEKRTQAAEERSRIDSEQIQQLRRQLEVALSLSGQPIKTGETVDITPLFEMATTEATDSTESDESEKETIANPPQLKSWDKIRVIDKKHYEAYYGYDGTVTGRSENGLWWMRLNIDDGYHIQLPAQAVQVLHSSENEKQSALVPIKERVLQTVEEVGRTLFQPSVVPAAG